MPSTTDFTPAWKRLGLKLTHFPDAQSERPGPRSGAPQGIKERLAPSGPRGRDESTHHHVAGLTENGKPIKLGKRRPHDSPADGLDHATKKSKKNRDHEQHRGKTEEAPLATVKEVPVVPEPKPPAPSTSDKPTGDLNYRRKKPRQEKQTKASSKCVRNGAQSKASHPEAVRASPQARSPSPGETDFGSHGADLLPSTESDFLSPQLTTSAGKRKKTSRETSREIANTAFVSTPRTDRRKSVTFTPDTKTSDGNSASNLFKKWVSEQKGTGADFSAAEAAQFAPPPKVHPANGISTSRSVTLEEGEAKKAEKKSKKRRVDSGSPTPSENGNTTQALEDPASNTTRSLVTGNQETEAAQGTPKAPNKATLKGKKKDHSVYLSYLSQYYNGRKNWKFNKAKQNDVLDNALNVFRIPDKYSEALLEYIKGLKGANVVARLIEKSKTALAELEEEEKKQSNAMDDAQMRAVAKQEALEERLIKEKRRRELDIDIEDLSNHPHPDGFILRLKRRRAEAVLSALNMAAPIPPTNIGPTLAPKKTRKRKLRTEILSDSSSSDETSSSESSSGSDSDSDSDSDDGSNSDSSTSVSGDGKSSDSEESSSGGESDNSNSSSEDEEESSGINEDNDSGSSDSE